MYATIGLRCTCSLALDQNTLVQRMYVQTAVQVAGAPVLVSSYMCVTTQRAPLLHPFTAKLFGEPCALSENLASHLRLGLSELICDVIEV